MKSYSIWSIVAIVLGLLLFGVNWIIEGYFELIVFIGFLFLLIGMIVSFIAMARKEEGSLKVISLVSFFIILFLTTWFEPFQMIRVLVWLKEMS